MMGALGNHIWQSTLFVIAVALLTLAFRRNRAGIRYWLWFSASVKFVVPFALLTALGSHLELAPPARTVVTQVMPVTLLQAAQPFPEALTSGPPIQATRDWASLAICSFWACGFAAVALTRLRSWLRIRAAVRSSVPIQLPTTVEVRSSPGLLEPGVFGWLHPILLLPAGIVEQLTPAQLEAVLAHELCHIRRLDNLTAAIHMIVEAVFWFHPLVWWIGSRLVEERERACDESVLRLGAEPRDYAEAILNVCKLYVESPLACVSGVTGADLKKRIEAIMANRPAFHLNFAKKITLTSAAVLALALPIFMGILNGPFLRAQIPSSNKVVLESSSVRPCRNSERDNLSAPGLLNFHCVDLVNPDGFGMIQWAYRAEPFIPIVNGPAWIGSELWDITAKAAGTGDRRMEGPMLQAVLEDRFKLRLHRETRLAPVYELTVAAGGHKLTPFDEGSCTPVDPSVRVPPLPPGSCPNTPGLGRKGTNFVFAEHRTSLSQAAQFLTPLLDRPVLDKTGIAGNFDFNLVFRSDETTTGYLVSGARAYHPMPSGEPVAPSIFTAMEEQLGLKLTPAQGPREFVVIDHVERPTEN